MKIKNIHLSGVGGIEHLELDFNSGLNLICGTNGIGKTTILEAISNAFTIRSSNNLKRNTNFEKGIIDLTFEDKDNIEQKKTYEIKEFEAYKTDDIYKLSSDSFLILYFKTNRELDYKKVDGIKGDQPVSEVNAGNSINTGIQAEDAKSWLLNRQLFSKQENSLTSEQIDNLNLALSTFSILDKNIRFSRILPDSLDILVNTHQGEIYLEYLSSGYKSCLYILLGIIKEIEYRFKNPRINVKNFEGVVLIDEIDLHLHPEWQGELVRALKKMIPKAQIIATTHSPNILQSVSANEIIPLTLNKNGDIYKKDLQLGKYGLQGWTIEEILTDVMGLKTTSSKIYNETLRNFDNAMDNEDVEQIEENYKILCEMLHPNSPIKKILEIQVAGLRDDKTR
ncbi:AAA family ATPase [Clostridium perfringens]|uniref:AAA family ATPase n=1 Tax=Clostridium perfringens TaxID=1502 RepID=UPI000776751F|nr:AAA family ATPase [Clostridium perfringens]AMN31750.1 hypothetical protein JFP55_02040 [Clostridium perfringens]MBO3378442.1 AAA family ATPase [Clostridium perfringens]MDK0874159.1 AAA family ATPase [Clostridium perfringens]